MRRLLIRRMEMLRTHQDQFRIGWLMMTRYLLLLYLFTFNAAIGQAQGFKFYIIMMVVAIPKYYVALAKITEFEAYFKAPFKQL